MALSKKELGNLIKEARKLKSNQINKRYTQQMLANDIDKSQSYIGDIESGRTYPSYVLLNQIASACGVSISFFDVDNSLNRHIDEFIKLQLKDIKDEDLHNIRDYIKNTPDTDVDYIYDYIDTNEKKLNCNEEICFKTPKELIKFLLKQPVIINSFQIDINKMDESEISKLTNDIISQLKLISYKYKK